MAIIKNVMVSINKDRAITDSQLYVYRNDHGILYKFTIRDVRYQFSSMDSNLVRDLGGVSAIIDVINPQGKVVAQAKQPIVDNKVEFLLTKEMTDEIQDVGFHQLHIHLLSANDGMVTLPPFRIEVKDNPMCSFNKPNGTDPIPPVEDETIKELEKAIGELGVKVTNVTETVTGISKQLVTTTGVADEAKKSSEANTVSLEEVNTKVAKAIEDSASANTLAKKATEDVQDVADDVTKLELWQTKTDERLDNITSKVEGAVLVSTQNSQTLKQVVTDGLELHKLIEAQEGIVAGHTTGLAKLGEQLTQIQADLLQLSNRVTALENKKEEI